MSTNVVLSKRERRLAQEAAEWRLISLLFECPSEPWRKLITELAQEVADADLKAAVEDALKEAEEGLFHYIFGPGGPAPAREATYHQTVELGYLMSELQAYYNAFGYQPRTAEAPDHVSVEAGFIAYLKLKQSFALAGSQDEKAAITAESCGSFIGDHLANMAQSFSDRLQESGIAYLAKASAALARRVGPGPAPSPFPILQDTDAQDELGCGSVNGTS